MEECIRKFAYNGRVGGLMAECIRKFAYNGRVGGTNGGGMYTMKYQFVLGLMER